MQDCDIGVLPGPCFSRQDLTHARSRSLPKLRHTKPRVGFSDTMAESAGCDKRKRKKRSGGKRLRIKKQKAEAAMNQALDDMPASASDRAEPAARAAKHALDLAFAREQRSSASRSSRKHLAMLRGLAPKQGTQPQDGLDGASPCSPCSEPAQPQDGLDGASPCSPCSEPAQPHDDFGRASQCSELAD